jgi:hypothetical protein
MTYAPKGCSTSAYWRLGRAAHGRLGSTRSALRLEVAGERSGGTFTVSADPDSHTATVTLRTTFEPLGTIGVDQLTAMIYGAFQQSLESLRRFVEDNICWDAS